MKIAVLEPLGVTNEDLASRIYAACYAYDGELEIELSPDRREDEASVVERLYWLRPH